MLIQLTNYLDGMIKKMNKAFEKLFYSLGFNLSGYNVDREIAGLEKNLPADFKQRSVIDLGCGDGQVSLKLKRVLKPRDFLGIDIHPALVKAAQKRGLNAQIRDISKGKIKGDLGILWGVLHHLEEPGSVLKKLNDDFNNLIIRESVDEKRVIEVGEKLNKKRLMGILDQAGVKVKEIVEIPENKSVLIFI